MRIRGKKKKALRNKSKVVYILLTSVELTQNRNKYGRRVILMGSQQNAHLLLQSSYLIPRDFTRDNV